METPRQQASGAHRSERTRERSAEHTTPVRTPARYLGVDYARFIAIIGMIGAHLVSTLLILPNLSDFERGSIEIENLITNGTSAALFAVLGGISIVFSTRAQLRAHRTGRAIATVIVRGLLIFAVGLVLVLVSGDIVVVLTYYGVAMIFVSPLVKAPSWVLITLVAALTLVFGWINIHLRHALNARFEGPHISVEFLQADPIVALRTLLITGEYPAITWVTYLMFGMLIGRTLVAAAHKGALGKTALTLAVSGLAAFAIVQSVSLIILTNLVAFGMVGPDVPRDELDRIIQGLLHDSNYGAPAGIRVATQFLATPHSGSIADVLRNLAIAAVVIGVLVWLCDRERPAHVSTAQPSLLTRFATGLAAAVRSAGAAPLTIYSLHILAAGLILQYYRPPDAPTDFELVASAPWWALGFGAFALQVGVAILIGAVLAATQRRGPLEALLSTVVSWVVPKPKLKPAARG